MRVLAVDDDPTVLDILEHALGVSGATCILRAENGRIALETVQRLGGSIDCILMDIDMPEMDGITATRQLRSLPQTRDTPIIMVTTRAGRSSIDEAFASGASDYLTKPFDIGELMARIRLVSDLVAHRQEAIRQTKRAGHLEGRLHANEAVPLSTVMSVGDEGGMVDYPWFEKFVNQLCHAESFAAGMVIFACPWADAAKRGARPAEVGRSLGGVADALSGVLAGRWFIASHAGNGVFAFVVQEDDIARADAIMAHLEGRLNALRRGASTDAESDPTLKVSEKFSFSGLSGDAIMTILRQSVHRLRHETAADARKAEGRIE